jgi:hypothetical protein
VQVILRAQGGRDKMDQPVQFSSAPPARSS